MFERYFKFLGLQIHIWIWYILWGWSHRIFSLLITWCVTFYHAKSVTCQKIVEKVCCPRSELDYQNSWFSNLLNNLLCLRCSQAPTAQAHTLLTPSIVWRYGLGHRRPRLYQLPPLIFNELSVADVAQTAQLPCLTLSLRHVICLDKWAWKQLMMVVGGGLWVRRRRRRRKACGGVGGLGGLSFCLSVREENISFALYHREREEDTGVCASDLNSRRRCQRCQK